MRKLKKIYKKSCNYFKYIIQLYCHNKQNIMTNLFTLATN